MKIINIIAYLGIQFFKILGLSLLCCGIVFISVFKIIMKGNNNGTAKNNSTNN